MSQTSDKLVQELEEVLSREPITSLRTEVLKTFIQRTRSKQIDVLSQKMSIIADGYDTDTIRLAIAKLAENEKGK
jgi:hypothetical protein